MDIGLIKEVLKIYHKKGVDLMPPKKKKSTINPKFFSKKTKEVITEDNADGKEVMSVSTKISTKAEIRKHDPKKNDEVSKAKVLKDDKELIDEKFFEGNPARIWMDYSHTVNLGKYESAKVSVGVSVPVGKEIPKSIMDNINKTHDQITEYIEARIGKEISELKQYVKDNSEDNKDLF